MLSGEEIINAIKNGGIEIKPFEEKNVNPNSYNLTLGDELLVYTDDVLDCKKENKTKTIKIPDEGYVLVPNTFYLASSNESIASDIYVPQISGRSSVGRIGLSVHMCACSGSVGYKGKWTFQITCVTPTKVYKGMEIGQIYFFPLIGSNGIKYKGHYNNSKKKIKTSKIYKEFEKE